MLFDFHQIYISYSSGLSEKDKLIIDKLVFANREAVCVFVRNISSNVKDKTKRLIIVISLATVVWFSGKVNNLPAKDITSINSFENCVH